MDTLIVAFGVIFGLLLFLIGITGWYAAKKDSRYLVCLVRHRHATL